MRKEYLHLSLYRCTNCKGPVVAASSGIREGDITRESEIKLLGAVCLSCGNRQLEEPDNVRRFPPVQWETPESVDAFDRLVQSSRSPRIRVSATRNDRHFQEEEASSRMVDEGCPNARIALTPIAGYRKAHLAPAAS
jgi:hypothetical protein